MLIPARMPPRMIPLFLLLWIPNSAAPAASDLDRQLAEADAAYADRHLPSRFAEARRALARAEELAPDDYGVLWRLARLHFWESDDPGLSNDARSRAGKRSWDYGERALTQNPSGVEGHYFAAVGLGNYSLGIGILKALAQGLEGKFRKRLGEAERLDPTFHSGAIPTAWGRFYYELPWPKYDEDKSEAYLRRALEIHPGNRRARLFLADLFWKQDKHREAQELLAAILGAAIDTDDPAEQRRIQSLARSRLREIEEELK